MPDIPPEIIPILAHLGIQNPAHSRWQRLDPWPGRRIHAHYFCPCGTREGGQQRLQMEHTWLANRRVFIGQCGWCMTIYWRDAVKDG